MEALPRFDRRREAGAVVDVDVDVGVGGTLATVYVERLLRKGGELERGHRERCAVLTLTAGRRAWSRCCGERR